MAAASVPKKVIGRYELGCEIATGWLGPLWLVRTVAEGELSAPALARRVPLASPGEDDGMDRVSEAAWTAMELKHDNIPTVLEVVVETDELAVITDHVEGVSLRTLQRAATSRRKPLAQPLALRIVADVFEAVTSAHEQGLTLGDMAADVHGGLTPDSVIVATDGRVRVTDILVAGAAARVRGLAHSPDRLAYAAPESVDGGEVGAPSDVFAGGVMLWELLSERRLFLGNSAEAVTQKLRSLKIPRLDELDPRDRQRIPHELSDLVSRALAREPEARFGSVTELLEAMLATGCELAQRAELTAFVEHVCEFELSRQRDALRSRRSSAGSARRSAPRLPATRPDVATPAAPSGQVAMVRETPTATVATPPPLRAVRLDSSTSISAQRAAPIVAPSPHPSAEGLAGAPQMPRRVAAKTLLGLAPPKPALRAKKTPPEVPAVSAPAFSREDSGAVAALSPREDATPTGSTPSPAEPAPRPTAPSWVAHEAETEAILETLAPVAAPPPAVPRTSEPGSIEGTPAARVAPSPAAEPHVPAPAAAPPTAGVPPPPPQVVALSGGASGAPDTSGTTPSFDLGSALAETLQQAGATPGVGAQDVSATLASTFPDTGPAAASAVPLIHDRRLEAPAPAAPAQAGLSRTLVLSVAVLASVAVLLGIAILVLLLQKPDAPAPAAAPSVARIDPAARPPSPGPEPSSPAPAASSAPTAPSATASSTEPEPPPVPDAGPDAIAPAEATPPARATTGAAATAGARAPARPRPKPKPRFIPDDI